MHSLAHMRLSLWFCVILCLGLVAAECSAPNPCPAPTRPPLSPTAAHLHAVLEWMAGVPYSNPEAAKTMNQIGNIVQSGKVALQKIREHNPRK